MSSPPPPPGLELDPDFAVRVLTGFLRDARHKTGLSGFVVELSGDAPSVLVAALAVRAAGLQRVHTFHLPCGVPETTGATAAHAAADALGLTLQTFDLAPVIEALFAAGGGPGPEGRQRLARPVRRLVLGERGAALACLVPSTATKSDLLLGRGTLTGDGASTVYPLGDLYGVQVRALARHLELPFHAEPRRDAAEDSTDAVLHQLFDRDLAPSEIVARGQDPDVVDEVVRQERRSRPGRRPPVVARLSTSAVNLDLELPGDRGDSG